MLGCFGFQVNLYGRYEESITKFKADEKRFFFSFSELISRQFFSYKFKQVMRVTHKNNCKARDLGRLERLGGAADI